MKKLIKLMGSETTEIKLQPGSAITVIMMAGLQGAGKTTTTAKLAGKFKLKGKEAAACRLRRIPSGGDQTVTDKWREAGRGSVFPWVIRTGLLILPEPLWSMRKRTAITL